MSGSVKKWGNSAAVRIPAAVLADAKIELDQPVEVREERGRIVIEPVRRKMFAIRDLVAGIRSQKYDLIIVNYANPDMVAHTGSWPATIEALEVIDACLARVAGAVERLEAADAAGPGAILAITADHGNADELRDADGRAVTAHSLNPVPFLLAGRAVDGLRLADGMLADVAPTLLELGGLPPWPEITGRSLLRR